MSIYLQPPASKYSSIMTWRRTHCVFVVAISPPVPGSPPWAEGTNSDELWPLVSLKYPTLPSSSFHVDPLVQAEQQAREQGRHIQEWKDHSHWSVWGTEFRLLLFPKRFAFSMLITEGACDAIWILDLFRQGGMHTQIYPSTAGIDQLESESFTFGCSSLNTGAQGSSCSPWFLTKVTSAVSLPISHKKCQLA